MFHPVAIFIGLRYLRGRSGDRFSRFVSYMSTAGITIGVMALVTVLSVMNGFEAQLKTRILGVLPQAVVGQVDEKTPRQASAPEFIAQLSAQQPPQAIVRSEAVIQSPWQLSAGLLLGVEPHSDDSITPYLIAGRITDLQPGSYQLFLGHTLAQNINVSVGDTVRLMVTSASQFTPLGRIPSQRNFTVAGLFNTGSDVDSQLMYTHIRDAGRLLRFDEQTISGWRVFMDDPFDVANLSKTELPSGWYWRDWREQRGELFQAVKMEKNIMGLMLGLIIGVAAFNIITALIMVVMEKQAEVAILKTQGMTDQQVLAIFMVQGASSGIIGAVIGGSLGALLAANINRLMELFGVMLFSLGGQLPIVINPLQIMVVVLLAIGLSLVATLFPAYRASTVKPAEALRYE